MRKLKINRQLTRIERLTITKRKSLHVFSLLYLFEVSLIPSCDVRSSNKESIRTSLVIIIRIVMITNEIVVTLLFNTNFCCSIIHFVLFVHQKEMMKNLKNVASQNLLPNRLIKPTKKQNKTDENDW